MPTQIKPDWLRATSTKTVMDAFRDSGKSAYFVGGCVRDALLGIESRDIDIATEATPDETLAIAQNAGLRAIPTGFDHGTVTVVSDGKPFEVTSFRRDVATDGRRAVVAFSTDMTEDALRRDFTMNALYADRGGMVLDPLGGLPDLQTHNVRFIEDAAQRIAEDYLRILRFFRFYAWYGDPKKGLNPEGLAACAAAVEGLDSLSRERVGAEMAKLLAAPDPAPAVASMSQSGVLARLLPGASAEFLAPLVHLEGQTGTNPSWIRRLAVLGGHDPLAMLRLSKADFKHLKAVRSLVSAATPAAEAGFRHGKAIALDAALVVAASLSCPLADDSISEIQRGATARFPVSAKDLQPALSGKALGTRLKQLEAAWFASGLNASRAELLD